MNTSICLGWDSNTSSGIITKVTDFISSKKGRYVIIGLIAVVAIYYYFQSNNKKNTSVNQEASNNQIPPAPPGYVTIPVEMFEEFQQQQQMFDDESDDVSQPNFVNTNNQIPVQQTVPKLKHNQKLEEEEDEEDQIRQQNLTQAEMESIQSQLNAMQQQRNSA